MSTFKLTDPSLVIAVAALLFIKTIRYSYSFSFFCSISQALCHKTILNVHRNNSFSKSLQYWAFSLYLINHIKLSFQKPASYIITNNPNLTQILFSFKKLLSYIEYNHTPENQSAKRHYLHLQFRIFRFF